MPVFPFFVFLIFFFPVLVVGIDDCPPTRCSKHGPEIRFPFRHKDRQPQHCGYHPGFDLYCDHKKDETVLELPSSVKVMVKKIDYVNQRIQIYDPEGCLPQKLLYHQNLSASPFQFTNSYTTDYILFNCSAPNRYSFDLVPCRGDSSYQFYAIRSDYYDPSLLISCTQLHKISSIPIKIFYQQNLHLIWSEPACGHCEIQGKLCRLKNNTRGHQLMCINKPVVQMLEGDGDDLTMPPNPFPASNPTDHIAGIPGRRYQTELALISELE